MPAQNKNDKEKAASGRKSEEVKVIDALLKNLATKLKQGPEKASIADYIRLLQLRKELDGDSVKEVKVQWVEEQ